jgi:hypothetical protein
VIDVLVNNAGIIKRNALPAAEYPRRRIGTPSSRSTSPLPSSSVRPAAKWWLDRRAREQSPEDARLKIVNIASMLSFQGGILVPAYTAGQERSSPAVTKRARLRVGQGTHQRERRRPRLHRHGKHPTAPRG